MVRSGRGGADKPSVPGPSRAVGGADSVPEPGAIRPAERFAGPNRSSEPETGPRTRTGTARKPGANPHTGAARATLSIRVG